MSIILHFSLTVLTTISPLHKKTPTLAVTRKPGERHQPGMKKNIVGTAYSTVFFIIFLLTIGCTSKKESSRFVPVNGKAQHIRDVGLGQPVVVLVTGFGDDLNTYDSIQKALSKITRIISYDRAGLGKSELTGKNRSLDTLAFELNEILTSENIAGPYVLVGHSRRTYCSLL